MSAPSTPQYSSWPTSESTSDTPQRHSRPYSYVPEASSSRPPRPIPSPQADARRSSTMPQSSGTGGHYGARRSGPSPPPPTSYDDDWDHPEHPPWYPPAHVGNNTHIVAGPGSYINDVGNNYYGATIYHGDKKTTSPGRRQTAR